MSTRLFLASWFTAAASCLIALACGGLVVAAVSAVVMWGIIAYDGIKSWKSVWASL